MADKAKKSYSYGEPNWELIGRWLELDPGADGPFWAVNLMKYRTLADYGDGDHGGESISGQEADDAYAPLGPLAAIGAMVTFLGDVADQPSGDPAWDRVGIVRYPSRAAFFAMQQRDDFKQQHVHKEAGMEFTIVAAGQPQPASPSDPAGTGEGVMVLRVRRFTDADAPRVEPAEVTPVALFDVEGVIVGDERTWHEMRFDRVPDLATAAALGSTMDGVDEMIAVVLEPRIDRLIESIVTASAVGG